MHVIVRRSLPLVVIAVFVTVSLLLLKTQKKPTQQQTEAPLPVLEVLQIQKQDIQLTVDAYGLVAPQQTADIVAQLVGTVTYLSPNFAAGMFVKKGEVLVKLDDGDYLADLAQAEATLAQAQAKLQQEIAQGKVAKQSLRQVSPRKQTALGRREPQRKQEEANVTFAKAAVERAKRQLTKTVITAPFDGLVTRHDLHIGTYVTLGRKLGELLGTAIAEVRLPVSAQSFHYLNTPQLTSRSILLSAHVGGRASPTWTATIMRSEGVINQDTRMIYLIAEVKDPYQRHTPRQPALQFGSFVTTTLYGKTVNDVIKLPRHVVRNDQVMVVDSDSRIAMRNVHVVRADQEHAYIIGGLNDGEWVSLIQPENLIDGTEVKTVISQRYSPDSTAIMTVDANWQGAQR